MQCPTKQKEDLRFRATDDGMRYSFVDLFGKSCSIQESPLVSKPAILLGLDSRESKDGLTIPALRMQLGRDQVRTLLPILQYFAQTGKLPSDLGEVR